MPWRSSSCSVSPSSFASFRRSLKLIFPDPSPSKRENAFSSSSSGFWAWYFSSMMSLNSSNSIFPDSSLSYSCMMCSTSCFLVANPRARMAVFSSR